MEWEKALGITKAHKRDYRNYSFRLAQAQRSVDTHHTIYHINKERWSKVKDLAKVEFERFIKEEYDGFAKGWGNIRNRIKIVNSLPKNLQSKVDVNVLSRAPNGSG